MSIKIAGAVLVVLGCGGFGFSLAACYRREEKMLRQLLRVLSYMECELQYRLSPLPELCHQAGREGGSCFQSFLRDLAEELDRQICPDAYSCMTAVLNRYREMPHRIRNYLLQLGHTLGQFDLSGQIQGLRAVRHECEKDLQNLSDNRETQVRSYRTLGLCAGAALAILCA